MGGCVSPPFSPSASSFNYHERDFKEETWPFWWLGELATLAVTQRTHCSAEATKSSFMTTFAPAIKSWRQDSNSSSVISRIPRSSPKHSTAAMPLCILQRTPTWASRYKIQENI